MTASEAARWLVVLFVMGLRPSENEANAFVVSPCLTVRLNPQHTQDFAGGLKAADYSVRCRPKVGCHAPKGDLWTPDDDNAPDSKDEKNTYEVTSGFIKFLVGGLTSVVNAIMRRDASEDSRIAARTEVGGEVDRAPLTVQELKAGIEGDYRLRDPPPSPKRLLQLLRRGSCAPIHRGLFSSSCEWG